jgi:hypothetical protein
MRPDIGKVVTPIWVIIPIGGMPYDNMKCRSSVDEVVVGGGNAALRM